MKIVLTGLLALALIPGYAAAEDVVRMHGATTTVELVIAPYGDAVEKAAGCRLEILPNRAGPGLIDLAEGECDIALTAADVASSFGAAETAGKKLDPANFEFIPVKNDTIVFAVNASNPVSKLSREQLAGIFSGKIANWKEVGGNDAPISVFTHNPNTATRTIIKDFLFRNGDYSKKSRAIVDQDHMASELARWPGAIAGISSEMLDGGVKVLETDKIARPLAFITKGKPQGKVKQVIDAFVSEAAKAAKTGS